MVRVSSVLWFVWPVLLISSCSTSYGPSYDPSETIYHPSFPKLENATTWTVQGKIGVKSSEGGANLGFVWSQMPDKYDINLTAALGAEVAHLSGSEAGVVLTLPDGQQFMGANVNELLGRQLGYPIPILQLRDWIRGMPAPRYHYKYDGTGFDQQGWQVTYRKLDSMGPTKIQIERGTTRVKLAALKWQY
jgi:outer membrane lipoprotein LolB